MALKSTFGSIFVNCYMKGIKRAAKELQACFGFFLAFLAANLMVNLFTHP